MDQENQNDLTLPRKRTKRLPYGYLDYPDYLARGGEPHDNPEGLCFPDPIVIPKLIEALDQLDAGVSLREAVDWLDANTPEGVSLSHAGLKQIRERVRPNYVRKRGNNGTEPKSKKMTREERMLYNRKLKLAAERRSLAAQKKRIAKKEEAVLELTEEKKISPVIEMPTEYDFESIPEDEAPIFKPNPGPQAKFLSAPELEVLYGGSAGGGKSYALLADPVRYFDNPNFNGILLRRTNDELRELIWKSQSLYKGLYPDAKWSEKKSSWTFPAGGHMWFTYLERDEDVLRYQGQAFTWVGFDELTQYPTPFAWNYLRSRLRTTDPTLKKSLSMRGTTNPGGPGHGWVKKMFVDPAVPGEPFPAIDLETDEPLVYPEGHEKAGKPLFYRRFIPASLHDNPYLANDGMYEANLMSLPESQRRQLLEGDWTVADGAAFSEFRTKIHTCDPFEIPHDWYRFRSCDFGYSTRQASAVHWYAVDPANDILYVYRELYVNQLTARELAMKILEMERGERVAFGVLDSSCWSQRGNTGPSIAEEMIRAGCRWRPSDRSQGSRIASKNRLHELLRVDPVSGKPGIIFFNTCRQIIADLPVIPQSKDDDDIDKKYASDHAYDSIRYGIQTRPRAKSPWDFGSSNQHFYRPADLTFGY